MYSIEMTNLTTCICDILNLDIVCVIIILFVVRACYVCVISHVTF